MHICGSPFIYLLFTPRFTCAPRSTLLHDVLFASCTACSLFIDESAWIDILARLKKLFGFSGIRSERPCKAMQAANMSKTFPPQISMHPKVNGFSMTTIDKKVLVLVVI
jgi:hypothetical protein